MRRRRAVADRGFAPDSRDSESEDEVEMETVATPAGRDRSQEFALAVRSLRGAAPSPQSLSRESSSLSTRPLRAHSDFMRSARLVSKNVAATYSKLEKLAALAKKKSLFDDRPAEIQELTYIIKGDLCSLNQQIAKLGEMPRGLRHVQSHSSSVVLALQSRLASMSAHFKQVLEVRSENLKHQNDRRERFTRGPPPPRGSATLLEDEQVSIDVEDAPGNGAIRTQRMVLRDETDDYAAQRAETMHNIESTIVELGGIFQQLAHMVKEQDEAVTRIDANVEDAELNVEAAHSQILKYFQSVSGNRMLMLKVFGVLILFFVLFVTVL